MKTKVIVNGTYWVITVFQLNSTENKRIGTLYINSKDCLTQPKPSNNKKIKNFTVL